MGKRRRPRKEQVQKVTSVEGIKPYLKQETVAILRSGRVIRPTLDTAASSIPLSPPPAFAPSGALPSLSWCHPQNNKNFHQCNDMTAMLRSPIRNVKETYRSRATGDFSAHLTTGRTHATEENANNPVQAKLEDQSFPTIHGVLGVENQEEPGVLSVENQEKGELSETLPALPEVVVENNAPPCNANGVLNTNTTRPETRSIGSGARPTKSGSVNFTRIAAVMNDCSSDDEVESRPDDMSVMINGYRIKGEASPILQKIFLKYGDIAKAISSVNISSSLLEFVCDICRKLEAKDLRSITTKELQSMLAEVRDLESAKVDVGWLFQRLNDISKAKQLLQEHNKLKKAETINKKALEELKEQLAAHIATCRALEERNREKEHELGTMDGENKRIRKSYANTKGKVKDFLNQSLLQDLL